MTEARAWSYRLSTRSIVTGPSLPATRDSRAATSTRRSGVSSTRLSDVISFGVAPRGPAYGVGMQGLWDVVVLLCFVACGVSRLARYNVTAEKLSAGGDKPKYYEGTPIPSSLLLVGVLALAAGKGRVGEALWGGSFRLGPGTLHPLVLLFALSGSLMISKTIRIPKL
jgi:CDP-diacylglycerol--serine O-phosphatidyltransferase